MKFAFKAALVAACGLALAGCGGGGNSIIPPRPPCEVDTAGTADDGFPGVSCRGIEELEFSQAARQEIAQGDARVGSLTQSSNVTMSVTAAGVTMTVSEDLIRATRTGGRVRIYNDSNDDSALSTGEWSVMLDLLEPQGREITVRLVGDVVPSDSGLVAAVGAFREDLEAYIVFGFWARSPGDFGFFADGTKPNTVSIIGTASYAGNAYVFVHPSDNIGEAAFFDLPVTINVQVDGTSLTISFSQVFASLFVFTDGTWDPDEMAFVGGKIVCAPGISEPCHDTAAESSWSMQFLDISGRGGVPDFLVGTFAVAGISVAVEDPQGVTVVGPQDLYGFIGSINSTVTLWDAQAQQRPGSILQAEQIRQAPAELAEAGIFDSDFFAGADRPARIAAIQAAGSSRDGSKPNELGVSYTSFGTHFATGFWSDEVAFGAFADTSGIPAHQQLPVSGSAVYSGTAGGVYASSSSNGSFSGAAEFTAEFGADAPSIRGAIDYDFAGAAGRLQLDNAQWDAAAARFDSGSIGCASGCTGLDESSWGGEFMSLDPVAQGARVPEAFVGTFGAAGLQMDGQQFDALGVFATATE